LDVPKQTIAFCIKQADGKMIDDGFRTEPVGRQVRSSGAADLHATILSMLGLDYEKLTYTCNGRQFRLTDVHGKVAQTRIA
jgi:hypothetical protein